MELFKRKRQRELPPLFSESELEKVDAVGFHEVLDYLVGLSDAEFKQIGEVATIHRKAEQDSAKAFGSKLEPTTFINPPNRKASESSEEPDYLDMLADEPNSKSKGRSL